MKKQKRSFLSVLFGLFIFLFWRVDSWLCSLPAWLTLILHFTVGLSIWWFWGTLFVWIAVGVLRYLLIVFARWGAGSEEAPKVNKNPYSQKAAHQPEITKAPDAKKSDGQNASSAGINDHGAAGGSLH